MKCSVCGFEFQPVQKKHYISRDLERTGVVTMIAATDEPALYDSFDCPECGCQVIAQSRKRVYIPASDEELLEEMPDSSIAAHLGIRENQLRKIYRAKEEGKSLRIRLREKLNERKVP